MAGMNVSQPIICKDCWPKQDNWADACQCVKTASESARQMGAMKAEEQLTTAKAELEAIRIALKGLPESDLESLAYAVMRDADACAEWARKLIVANDEAERLKAELEAIRLGVKDVAELIAPDAEQNDEAEKPLDKDR